MVCGSSKRITVFDSTGTFINFPLIINSFKESGLTIHFADFLLDQFVLFAHIVAHVKVQQVFSG